MRKATLQGHWSVALDTEPQRGSGGDCGDLADQMPRLQVELLFLSSQVFLGDGVSPSTARSSDLGFYINILTN